MTAAVLLLAVLAGAAWRRWYGSARPSWAFPGYRGLQIAVGIAALASMCWVAGDQWWRALAVGAAAVGFMTLPIKVSRRPFEWLMERINPPKMWGTMLSGPAPWSEALQGAALWTTAILV